jgi:hypothetical protein
MAAEVEYKGIKIGGSKLLLLIPLLGTIIGGAYGCFEVYTQFKAMEKKIAAYKPVNVSHLEKQLLVIQGQSESTVALVDEQIGGFRTTVSTLQDLIYDLKITSKEDLSRLQGYLDKQDVRNRDNVDLVRTLITDWESRIDDKLARQEDARVTLDKDLREVIRKVLQNPLAAKIN